LWAKPIVNDEGKVHQMCCMIFTSMKGKENLEGPKLDSSFKHVGHKKCKRFMPKVDACSYYVNNNLGHSKNEQ
jgi:hypothetical protein